METKEIRINNKNYEVLVAISEEDKAKGLQGVVEMDDNEGCLFIYEEPSNLDFWMVDTLIPLDIIFIDSNKEVISVKKGTPKSDKYISENNAQYVLELSINSGIEPGDILELEEEYPTLEPNKMFIIGSDGTPQAELLGGERIFSRKSTKVIMRKAEKAYNSKSDVDYRSLGRYIFGELNAQDKRQPQYVESKEKIEK